MAANLNITLEQFSSYTLELTINNAEGSAKDLTGYTGEFKVAKRSDKTKVFEIDGTNGTITMPNPTEGKVTIFIKEVDLPLLSTDNNVTLDPVDYYYTFKIISSTGIKTRVIDGLVAVAPGIQ